MILEEKIISMQERLKDGAYKEIGDLFYFANEYYGEYLLKIIDDFTDKANLDEEFSSMMIPHLISWAIFCHQVDGGNKTIFQKYLDSPEYRSRRKPKIHRILSEWKYTFPGFYYVEEILGEIVLVVTDVFQLKEKLVGVYNEVYHQPRAGDMVIGYLLPARDSAYSPIIDFFLSPPGSPQKRNGFKNYRVL